jgi:hypothetical protein
LEALAGGSGHFVFHPPNDLITTPVGSALCSSFFAVRLIVK